MKMKKVLVSFLAAAMCIPAFAQEKVEKPSSFKDNWYLQLQGGASYNLTKGYKDHKFMKMVSPSVAVAIGKDFTPVFGLRLQGTGWESKNYFESKDETYKRKYFQINADGTFNFTNFFLPYSKDRMFNLIGIAGFAYVHGMKESNTDGKGKYLSVVNMISPRVGLKADFLITNNVSLNLEVAGNLLERRFSGVSGGKSYDGLMTALGGITVHFNNRGFDFVDYIDPSELDKINGQLNQLRSTLNGKDARISQLEAELAQKPKEIVKTKEVEDILMNAVVVFKLGKAELQDNQDINIFNAAKFFQEHPEYNCLVTGYADKATGNAKINQQLSEKRAQAVANVLTNKYGIPASRIIVQASGDKEQPFQNDAWNRVVIFNAVKVK